MNLFESIDFWKFLAGLGIFLFAVYLLEDSMKHLAGRTLKTWIRNSAGARWKGILTGTLGTAVMQGRSTVYLIALSFLGVGWITLFHAISVMIGANIGSTVTVWLIAGFGVKFQVEMFALPIIGVGGLGLIFLKYGSRYANLCKFVMAFGFLFLGFDYITGSVEALAESVNLAALTGLGLWAGVPVGMVLAMILRSASATVAIVLALLFTGVIDFQTAASFVIGVNFGIAVRVLLGSIGGVPFKKQAAASLLILVLMTAALTFLLLPVLAGFILGYPVFSQNPLMGLALFHTFFNVLAGVLFYPLIPSLGAFIQQRIPEQTSGLARFIRNTAPDIPEAATAALRKEVIRQLELSMALLSRIYGIQTSDSGNASGGGIMYVQLEHHHAEIFQYYSRMLAFELDRDEAGHLERYIQASRRIMDLTTHLYELHSQVEGLRADDSEFLQTAFERFRERIRNADKFVKPILKQEMTEQSREKLEDM
ncbi:MAG: Na/Pi symporter, partial [Balneolaceae bacterium]